MKINLYYTSKELEQKFSWDLGSTNFLGKSSLEGLERLNKEITREQSEYLIFIDLDKYELPSKAILLDIINNRPGEIWHVGNKTEEFVNKPILHDYFRPIWIYNLTTIESLDLTSWKLSGDCFLARTDIIMQLDLQLFPYKNIHAWGLDLGYRCLKYGAIIRYCADLTQPKDSIHVKISLTEEATFIKRNIGIKWLTWCLLRHFFRTGKAWSCLNSYLVARNVKSSNETEIKRQIISRTYDLNVPKVAVFAPTLYRYSYLEEELKQLRKQTILPNKIIITDQTNESDRDDSWLKDYQDLPILYQPQNEKGQCNAWNYCLLNTDAEYVLFLGDDADEIYPEFIEDLYKTMIDFKADVVGCNIKEREFNYPFNQKSVFVTDLFPICLVRRSVFVKSGGYDYAYNKGIRADKDVAIRIVLNGGLMVLNPQIKLHHHRAPVGGLRYHKQRVITNSISKSNIWKFQLPAFSEIYQHKRYFSKLQQREALIIKIFSLFSIHGNLGKKIMKVISLIIQGPILIRRYSKIKNAAKLLEKDYPKIQEIR